MYVVIYDTDEMDGLGEMCEAEQYYGYFDSAEQAEQLYRDMIRGNEGNYRNARVCQVVKVL